MRDVAIILTVVPALRRHIEVMRGVTILLYESRMCPGVVDVRAMDVLVQRSAVDLLNGKSIQFLGRRVWTCVCVCLCVCVCVRVCVCVCVSAGVFMFMFMCTSAQYVRI